MTIKEILQQLYEERQDLAGRVAELAEFEDAVNEAIRALEAVVGRQASGRPAPEQPRAAPTRKQLEGGQVKGNHRGPHRFRNGVCAREGCGVREADWRAAGNEPYRERGTRAGRASGADRRAEPAAEPLSPERKAEIDRLAEKFAEPPRATNGGGKRLELRKTYADLQPPKSGPGEHDCPKCKARPWETRWVEDAEFAGEQRYCTTPGCGWVEWGVAQEVVSGAVR